MHLHVGRMPTVIYIILVWKCLLVGRNCRYLVYVLCCLVAWCANLTVYLLLLTWLFNFIHVIFVYYIFKLVAVTCIIYLNITFNLLFLFRFGFRI